MRLGLHAARPIILSPRVSLATRRRLVDALTRVGRAPRGTRCERSTLGGVPCERTVPPGLSSDRVLLYLHGGGYALGSARAYRGFAAQLAAAAGANAVVPDYRLSPEHPYPAALDDVIGVYRALLDGGHDATSIMVVGDSAGGGLTLALAASLRDLDIAPPAVLGLICPWLDLAADAARTRVANRDPLIIPSIVTEWVEPYLGGRAATDPLISPVLGDLSGLPPIVVHSAGHDPLAVDVDALVAGIGASGGGVIEHSRYPRLWHVFHLQAGLLAAADGAVSDLAAALRRHADAAQGQAVSRGSARGGADPDEVLEHLETYAPGGLEQPVRVDGR
jgi:acetyl esterase/lipase